jgi:shikimate kinase
MKNIVLIGFMGSGKTAVSRALARKAKMMLLDTDSMIVKRSRMSIKRIFALYGEDEFRKRETKAAIAAAKSKNAVIATGGGIVTRKENIRALKKSGAMVYLKNSFAVSAKRLSGRTDRPLFDHKNIKKAKALFNKRRRLYSAAADLTVVTDRKSLKEVVEEIIRKGEKKAWL